LEKKLSGLNLAVGLDAGSAGFKNRKMFKTGKYFGLDINLPALKKGLEKYNSADTFGILGDLVKLDFLPANSVDVVVSTNTLYSLPLEKRIMAIRQLCRLTVPLGYLFCQLSVDEELDEALKVFEKNFKNIKKVYFKNPLSLAYESIFEKNGFLGSHPLAGTRPFLLFAWLISRLEYLTGDFRSLNKQVFIICTGKNNSGGKNDFDLSKIPKIEDRLYNALD
jgi:hypothetical protein